MSSKIIVIDDDRDYLELLGKKLAELGYTDVLLEERSQCAAERFQNGGDFDLALIDMTMPEMGGMELLELVQNTCPSTECIMITAINEARVAVECLRKGAYDYLVKPIAKDALSLSIHRTMERKRMRDILDWEKRDRLPEITQKPAFAPIITRSKAVLRVLMEAELHAASNVPVLITGESGTGKELLARAIHCASPRAKYPFTPVNMASLTPNLFEAEFFGHTKGAFTGAHNNRIGYLEHTDKGTLFLDEIGDLPLELQGKLMRVLQNGEFIKLGTSQQQRVDLRFIAATNENLERMIARRAFRKDLYYRIRGGWLHLPPLRDRKEDIPLLVNQFLTKYYDTSKNRPWAEESALALLQAYDYPGNIRELKSIIQSAVNLSQGQPLSAAHLPEHLRVTPPKTCACPPNSDRGADLMPLAQVEKEHIIKVFQKLSGNKSQTARTLGIGLNTLRRKLETYGLN